MAHWRRTSRAPGSAPRGPRRGVSMSASERSRQHDFPQRGLKHQRPRRRFRLRWLALAAVVVLLSPAVYSYTTTMLQPSSLPLGVRSVEWLRAHHGNWLVDEVEHVYYSWKAPKQGRPAAEEPAGGRLGPGGRRAPTRQPPSARPWPRPGRRRSSRSSRSPCPARGSGSRTGPLVGGRPPVLVTTFRTERDYPRIVAYVAWFDHTRTSLAFYPGRYEPPSAPVRGPMTVPDSQRWRLLATFNGGFIYADGHNGSSIDGRTYEPLKDGLATLIAYRDGRVDIKTVERRPKRRARGRLRPPEPAADHRGRTSQPGPERQLAVGLHARKRGPRLAHRRRHRPSRQPDLRRRRLPDGDHLGADPAAGRRGSGDAARHQPRVADADHLQPPRRPRPDQGRAQPPAARDPLPRPRRPRLLRRLPAPAGPGHRALAITAVGCGGASAHEHLWRQRVRERERTGLIANSDRADGCDGGGLLLFVCCLVAVGLLVTRGPAAATPQLDPSYSPSAQRDAAMRLGPLGAVAFDPNSLIAER